jgi:hypothetical protein
MRQFRPLFVFSAALIGLFALAGIVSAGVVGTTYTVTITDVSCEEISFEYVLNSESSNGADFAEFEVLVDGTPVVSGSSGPYDGTVTTGLNLASRAAPYFIEVIVYIPQYASGSATVQVVCGEEPGEVATGQICFGRGAVAATVFIRGDSIDIYAINPQDNGELVMSFTQEYLRTIPAGDEARLLGDSDRHIPIEFYRNANRLYRMVAGPDAEGKFFECTFGGACSNERTWIGEANRPTDEVVPVCNSVIVPTPTPTMTPPPFPF